jgi:hypothetical protein
MATNRKTHAPADGFCSNQFSPEELALVAAFLAEPTLDDVTWLERVLTNRLFADIDGSKLTKVCAALAAGTRRVSRMKARQETKAA